MQVLNLELTFGNNEIYMEDRTLEIHIDDKYPLQFSIINARYDISSFEENSVAKLQLKSISPIYDTYSTTPQYKVNLYLKFPLNTFATSDKVVGLTFDEYNTATKNYNIEFTSLSQIEENKETDENFKNIAIIIFSVFIFTRLIFAILESVKRMKESLKIEISSLIDEREKTIRDEDELEETYPKKYIENEMDRLIKLKNQIYQKCYEELEKVSLEMQEKMQKIFITRKSFDELIQKAKKIIEEERNELRNLNELEKPLREQYRQEELRQQALIEEQLSYIDGLADGYMFEEYTAVLLKKLGYRNVEVTPGSGDYGVDVLAEKDGITYAIQCKLYSGHVGSDAIQQIYTGKKVYKRQIRNSYNKQ